MDTFNFFSMSHTTPCPNKRKKKFVMVKSKKTAPPSSKGKTQEAVISYQLSDPTFVMGKWTKLPPIKSTAYSLPTRPWSCFKKREVDRFLYYPKGQLAAKYVTNGTGKIYYIDGSVAIELSESEVGYQRIKLYSGKLNSVENKCLGWLDSFGNCVLCDLEGNVIANYNQTGGVIFNKDGYWKWNWSQLVKRNRTESTNTNSFKRPKVSQNSTVMKTTSDLLLNLHITNSPSTRSLKLLQDGKISFQCKITPCLSLWISSQDKIDLSFSSNSFITRLDVGVSMGEDPDSHSKRQSLNSVTPKDAERKPNSRIV